MPIEKEVNIPGFGRTHSVTVDLDAGETLKDQIKYAQFWAGKWVNHITGNKIPNIAKLPVSPGFFGKNPIEFHRRRGFKPINECPKEIQDFHKEKDYEKVNAYYIRTTKEASGQSTAKKSSRSSRPKSVGTTAKRQSKPQS